MVLYPRSPIIREHLIVIPMRHTLELNDIELIESYKLVNKIYPIFNNAVGYNLFTNRGEKAGSTYHIFIGTFLSDLKEKKYLHIK